MSNYKTIINQQWRFALRKVIAPEMTIMCVARQYEQSEPRPLISNRSLIRTQEEKCGKPL